MAKRFYKHKVLIDEQLYHRRGYPLLNEHFDVKHIRDDLHLDSLPDPQVYELAVKKACWTHKFSTWGLANSIRPFFATLPFSLSDCIARFGVLTAGCVRDITSPSWRPANGFVHQLKWLKRQAYGEHSVIRGTHAPSA